MRLPDEHPIATAREWAKILIPLLALVAAIFAAAAAWRQFDLADHRFQADQRPWINTPTFTAEDATYSNTGLSVTLNFVLKNSGSSPAQQVAVSFDVYLGPLNFTDARKKACAHAETSMAAITVFPKDETPWGVGSQVSEADLEQARKTYGQFLPGSMAVVCIAYKSSLDQNFHHTPYALTLQRAEAVNSPLASLAAGKAPEKTAIVVRNLPISQLGLAD